MPDAINESCSSPEITLDKSGDEVVPSILALGFDKERTPIMAMSQYRTIDLSSSEHVQLAEAHLGDGRLSCDRAAQLAAMTASV
jgi:hypothetical protein